MNKRNLAVEFYRFLFSLVVCLFHFRTYVPRTDGQYPFDSGYLGVEFFLLLSGVFLAQAAEKNSEISSGGAYFLQRYKRLYPQYLITVLCLAVLRIFVIGNLTFEKWLREGVAEILMFQSVGTGNLLSLVLWYPSAILLASFCLYSLRTWNKKFCQIVFPIAAFGIFSALIQANGSINVTFSYHYLFSDGLWRALAGMMFGCICYDIIVWFRNFNFAGKKLMFTLIELVLLAAMGTILYLPRYWESLAMVLFAVFIVLILSQTSYLSDLLNNRVSRYLGKISYAVYLNQIVVYLTIFKFFPAVEGTSFAKVSLIYLAIVICLAVVTTFLIDGVRCVYCAKRSNAGAGQE